MASLYRFKDITTTPDAKSLVDIVLSQTQRRTPTQVHPQFKISRIRSFYMRKVKFCQQTFHDKFTEILTQFPRLDDIHPFYADLCNVLYDRDHYKIALGQVNVIRQIVDRLAKDYVRLLKYADSPYKCKMLKRAALGRMCSSVRRLQDAFAYLEKVRQHLSRLPAINPTSRCLLLTGFPNVGKSSFINAVTHANVEVQPFAFTTKSLYVGHFDYGYSRWQVIDTPGILDQPLSSRNTIELTAITALAHLPAAILYFVDISEQCGFSIAEQVKLFHSIKVLFTNKPLVIVLNKIDVMPVDSLSDENKQLLEELSKEELPDQPKLLPASCLKAEGVDQVKKAACDLLLEHRVEKKLQNPASESLLERLQATDVKPLETRPPNIPQSVLERRAREATVSVIDEEGVEASEHKGKLSAKEIEELCGGPGVHSVDLNAHWQLRDPNWTYDMMPEIFGGKNVLDFIDPEIEKRLEELEKEEARILEEQGTGFTDPADGDWEDVAKVLDELHSKAQLKRLENRLRTSHAHKVVARTRARRLVEADMRNELTKTGYEPDGLQARRKSRSMLTRRVSSATTTAEGMSDDDEGQVDPTGALKKRLRRMSNARTQTVGSESAFATEVARARAATPTRLTKGVRTDVVHKKVKKLEKARDKDFLKIRRAGESDRFIGTKRPKHLFSGKRGIGKTDRR